MDQLYFKVVFVTGVCGFALFAFAANSLNPFALPGRSRLRLQHRAARWAGCILALSPLALLIKPPLSVSGGVRFSILCAAPLLALVAIIYLVKRLTPAGLATRAGSSETPGNEIQSQELPGNSGELPGRAEPVVPHGPKPSMSLETAPPVATDRKPVGINADRQRGPSRVLRRKATGRNDKTAELMVS